MHRFMRILTRDEAREMGEAARAFAAEAMSLQPRPATYEEAIASVVTHYFDSRGHTSYWVVLGKRENVLAYVAFTLQTDSTTQCYEHMAVQVSRAGEDETIGVFYAVLSRNGYAGD